MLLLLSALLSALTGIGTSVRAPEVAQAVASRLETRAAPASPRTIAVRPRAALPVLAAIAFGDPVTVFSPRSAEPLWANRRRE